MPNGTHDVQPALVLGWRLQDDEEPFEPLWWTVGSPVVGKHRADHLIQTAARGMAYHSVIVAQSGSGKSFFLGRLIEEIALKTRSRIIILDPNSDFRRIWSVVDKSLWENAGYNRTKRSGFLPDEATREAFEEPWSRVKKAVYTANEEEEIYYKQLQLDWTKIPIEILCEGLGPSLQTEIRHCHDAVGIINDLLSLTKSHLWDQGNNRDLLEISKKMFLETRGKTEKQTAKYLAQLIPFDFNYFQKCS
jgi:hypothetical protein